MNYADGLAALKATPKADTAAMSRFLANVSPVASPKGCWTWTGGKSGGNGYGVIRVNGKAEYAHRVSHELFKGPIPAGKMGLPTWTCRVCVNPAHIYAGTHAQNMADAVARGSFVRKGKLRPAQVLAIVEGVKNGKTNVEMAKAFDTSVETVARILQGKSWTKLTKIEASAPIKRKRKPRTACN